METKFHLLAIGQHFEWEGKSYVKTTPLIAAQVPEGGQKFMPRAALVRVAGAEAAQVTTLEAPAMLDSESVRSALYRHHQRCLQACTARAMSHDAAAIKAELENLYRDLLTELKL